MSEIKTAWFLSSVKTDKGKRLELVVTDDNTETELESRYI